jgi:hypothetical protein
MNQVVSDISDQHVMWTHFRKRQPTTYAIACLVSEVEMERVRANNFHFFACACASELLLPLEHTHFLPRDVCSHQQTQFDIDHMETENGLTSREALCVPINNHYFLPQEKNDGRDHVCNHPDIKEVRHRVWSGCLPGLRLGGDVRCS